MTALTRYDRLEAPGLWRATRAAQRQNVIVSLGDATLKITDMSERVLAHWSLAALVRLNPGETPALFAPSNDPDEEETLEIDDAEMLGAVETVRKAIDRARPRAGRLRLILTLALVAALGTGAVTWLPGALQRQTLSVLPGVTRAGVGDQLLERLRRVAGTPCTGSLGRAALSRLGARVLGNDRPVRLVVVRSGVATAAHLPGGLIVLNRALIEDHAEPDVAAGFLIAEAARAAARDPMADLLDHAGTVATLKLLTTGKIDAEVLDSYAEVVLTQPAVSLPDATLVARFAEARVRTSPYSYALDPSGETVLGLIEADPVPLAEAEPLLADADWVSLQGICMD